jgi:hypothetical protein
MSFWVGAQRFGRSLRRQPNRVPMGAADLSRFGRDDSPCLDWMPAHKMWKAKHRSPAIGNPGVEMPKYGSLQRIAC